MIVCAGFMKVDPTNIDKATPLINRMVETTKGEDGCLDYSFSASLDTPGEFRIFEEWDGEESIGAHMGAAHMSQFLEEIGPMITGFEVNRFDGAEKKSLF